MTKLLKKAKTSTPAFLLISLFVEAIKHYKEVRVALAVKSFRFFCWYYLNTVLFSSQERWAIKITKTRRGLVLAPAGHGKTELISKLLPIWMICKNRNIRILLTSSTDSLAKKNLKVVQWELRYNRKLIEDFGLFYSNQNIWGQKQIYVIRDKNLKDPTVEAVGMNCAITGGRFDLEIFDDIIDANSVITESARKRDKNYVDGTLIPRLEPDGKVWAIGTRKDYDDVYGHFLENPFWTVIHEKAIIREPENFEIFERPEDDPVVMPDGTEIKFEVKIAGNDRGEVCCKEIWPIEFLLLQRFTIGSVQFNREYQNIIVDDENSLFKLPWLESCKNADISYYDAKINDTERSNFVVIIQGVDTALIVDKKQAEVADGSYNVIISLGLKKNGDRQILRMYRERGLSPKGIDKAIRFEYNLINPLFMFVEDNVFRHVHDMIKDTDMRLVKHHTGTNKHDAYDGIPALSVHFENHKYQLPYKTPDDRELTNRFISEFHHFGLGDKDDIVLATWIAENGIMRYMRGIEKRKSTTNRRDVHRR